MEVPIINTHVRLLRHVNLTEMGTESFLVETRENKKAVQTPRNKREQVKGSKR